MQLYKSGWKQFLRLPHISIVVALLFCLFLAENIRQVSIWTDAFNPHASLLRYSWLLFAVFLYLGYELRYDFKRSGIEEAVSALPGGARRGLQTPLLVGLTVALLFFLTACGFHLLKAWAVGVQNGWYYAFLLSSAFLNIFMPCVVALLMGCLLAEKFQRVSGYSIAVLIIMLASSALDVMLFFASRACHFDLHQFKWPISMLVPPNTQTVADIQYGVSNEIFRYNLAFFWVFLLVGLLTFFVCKRRTRTAVAVLICCAAFALSNVVGYFQVGYRVARNNDYRELFVYDYEYYRYAEKKEEDAGFTVIQYDMSLKLWRELQARVTVTLENPKELTEYKFTLYRDFAVDEVRDGEGHRLDFRQEGDYLTVTAPAKTKEMVFSYSGHSNIFFSNVQAAALVGSFAYYPIAGFHALSDSTVEVIDGKEHYRGTQGYLRIGNGYAAQYTICVDSILPIYSNLPSAGERNCFVGRTVYPTLMSGMIEPRQVGKYRCYALSAYPRDARLAITEADLDALQEEINKAEKELGAKRHLDLSQISIFEGTEVFFWAFYPHSTLLEDHLILRSGVRIKDATELVEEYNGGIKD